MNSLTLDMHEDHITVLLGNNGAGKSSTMSMLSGTYIVSLPSFIILYIKNNMFKR